MSRRLKDAGELIFLVVALPLLLPWMLWDLWREQ